MGYWYTEPGGASMFAPVGTVNADGTDMRWGDGPSDELCAGLDALITRLRAELNRYPSIAEVNAQKRTAWEMRRALRAAATMFREDLGRPPSRGEVEAGLNFTDTAIALQAAVSADISAGDIVGLSAPGHEGAHAVVEDIDLGDDPSGSLEVLVAVRTADGRQHLLEPRYVQLAESHPQ